MTEKKYTLFREADKIIDKYMKVIVGKIKDEIPDIVSIILFGGYGRGEGAVEFVGKKPRVLNDFDIYLITKKQIDDDFLEELGKKCSELIGKGGLEYPENYNKKFDFETFFNVDLRCIPYSRLRNLPPIVRYFELKNSSMLVYGKNIFPLIPEIKQEDLPFSEGIRLLSNRMMSMFLSMKEEYFGKTPSRDEVGIINYYIAKAYLACCESLLLFAKKFQPTYRGRAKVFSEIYKKEFSELAKVLPELDKRVKFATDYKLNPDIKKMNYRKEWFKARKHITEVMRYIISKIVGKKIDSFEKMSEVINNNLERIYFDDYSSFLLKRFHLNFKLMRILLNKAIAMALSFLYFKRLKKEIGKYYWKAFSFKDPGLKILSATPLVLMGLDESGKFGKKYLERISKILEKVYPIKATSSWKELKENYLEAYKLYYLRRFV